MRFGLFYKVHLKHFYYDKHLTGMLQLSCTILARMGMTLQVETNFSSFKIRTNPLRSSEIVTSVEMDYSTQ
jgi:hypothetical protein